MPNSNDKIIIFDRKKYLKYIRDLGQGGTGTTILCKDEALDMLFAVKKYAPTPQNDIAENYERFVDEIKILYNLNHPNIVRVYMPYMYPDFKTGYILMEYVDGQSIDQFMPSSESGWEELFLDAIDAFKYMHLNQVLHRDIRPSNILVDTNGRVKIIDFGFSKKLETNESAGHSIFLNWPVTELPKEVMQSRNTPIKLKCIALGSFFLGFYLRNLHHDLSITIYLKK